MGTLTLPCPVHYHKTYVQPQYERIVPNTKTSMAAQVSKIIYFWQPACTHSYNFLSTHRFLGRHCSIPKGSIDCPFKDSVPKTIPGVVFATRVLKWAVYGPFGIMFGYLDPLGHVSRITTEAIETDNWLRGRAFMEAHKEALRRRIAQEVPKDSLGLQVYRYYLLWLHE